MKNWHFATKEKRKSSKQHGQGNFLKKFPKKLSHIEEKSYEIVKGLDIFSSFLLLKLPYLTNRF